MTKEDIALYEDLYENCFRPAYPELYKRKEELLKDYESILNMDGQVWKEYEVLTSKIDKILMRM